MPKTRTCSVLILIFILSLSAGICSYADGPAVVYLYPDSMPVQANLFFPAGSPLERFTSQRDAWYAIYRTSLYPGYPYTIIIRHNGDPGRMKLYAMDNHPSDRVAVKMQLVMKRVDPFYHSYKWPSYQATVSLPERARYADLFLLLEWLPPAGSDRPLPVSVQVVSTGYGQLMGRGRQFGRADSLVPESSLRSGRPVVIPFPER